MKKILLGILFTLLVAEVAFLYGAKTVVAKETTPSGIERVKSVLKERLENRKEKVTGKRENIKEKVEERKEDRTEMIRKSVGVRVDIHKRAIHKAEKLLEKLQARIDRAKEAGKDVSEAERLMGDATNRLAQAKAKLESIESKKGTAIDKSGFQEIHQLFQGMREDLHEIRKDASKIISTLRGFNSATSSGQNPQKDGTGSASSSSVSR